MFRILLQHRGEAVKAALPVGAMVTDPAVEAIESVGVNAAGADAADFFGADEGALLKDLEMLADGGQGNAEMLGEARHRGGRAAEAIEDGAARGVAERVEETVDVVIGFTQNDSSCWDSVAAAPRRGNLLRVTGV